MHKREANATLSFTRPLDQKTTEGIKRKEKMMALRLLGK